ncbi:hypothetical protein [Pseudomonas alloputida]|uniref:hypothetical protein n=1 Tax=Pseudomonas TaxID=286 RepID=UPI003EEE1B85
MSLLSTYRLAYDTSDRLDEIGYGAGGERPERSSLFARDSIGQLLAKVNHDARQAVE